jgi:hypothetical protein
MNSILAFHGSLKALWLMLAVLLVSSCNWVKTDSTQLTVGLAGQGNRATLSRAAISQTYPSLGQLRLAVQHAALTLEQINKQFNGGTLPLSDDKSTILLGDTLISLVVPKDLPLTVTVSAYNVAGYKVFSGSQLVSVADLSRATVAIAVAMRVDIDSAVPVLATNTTCNDADLDGYCDLYEDLFVNASGQPDIDGDGLLNSQDIDADGDLVDDQFDHNPNISTLPTLSNFGYPMFIVKNRLPSLADVAVTTAENTPFTLQLSAANVDVDGNDEVVFTLRSGAEPEQGSVAIDPTEGEIVYTPNNFFFGTDSFDISMADLAWSSVGYSKPNFRVTVTVVDNPNVFNTPPTFDSRAVVTVNEGELYSYTVSASDVDVGDSLTLNVPTRPTWLTFDSATGLISGTPSNAEVGDHAVVVRVNDGHVDVDQTFTVTVANVNSAPVALNDSDYQSTPGAHVLLNVLANDYDPDPNILQGTGLRILSATTDEGEIRISPKGTYLFFRSGLTASASATIDYVIEDSFGLTDTATIVVRLNNIDMDGDGLSPLVATNGSAVLDPDDNLADTDGDSFSDFYESFVYVASAPSNQWTAVSTNITVDTLWTLAGSPYVLADQTISLTDNAQLIIEQGVEIKSEGSASHLLVSAGASLSVLGGATDALAVQFTSFDDDGRQALNGSSGLPTEADWLGIQTDSAAALLFTHVRVYYAVDGLTLNAGDAEIDDATFELSSGAGLTLNTSGLISVSDSQFAVNNQGLVVTLAANPTVLTNNIFRSNSADQISMDGSGIYLADNLSAAIEVSNSLFVDNTSANKGGALYVGANVETRVLNNTFYDNRVTPTKYNGGAIYVANGTDTLTFIDNVFDRNTMGGEVVSDINGYSSAVNALSQYNTTDAGTSTSGSRMPSSEPTTNNFQRHTTYHEGFYLSPGNMAIDNGSLSSGSILPSYLARLVSPTTDASGVLIDDLSANALDIGFHQEGPSVLANASLTNFSPTVITASSDTQMSVTILVTPRTDQGQRFDATADVTFGSTGAGTSLLTLPVTLA